MESKIYRVQYRKEKIKNERNSLANINMGCNNDNGVSALCSVNICVPSSARINKDSVWCVGQSRLHIAL